MMRIGFVGSCWAASRARGSHDDRKHACAQASGSLRHAVSPVDGSRIIVAAPLGSGQSASAGADCRRRNACRRAGIQVSCRQKFTPWRSTDEVSGRWFSLSARVRRYPRCTRGRHLSRPYHPLDRALSAGRHHRHSGAHHGTVALRRLGQQVAVDNRPGAGNNIGTELAIKSTPDGYTVFLVNPANAINATLYTKLPFNFLNDMIRSPAWFGCRT